MNSRVEAFRSKRDWWITAIMWGVAIASSAGTLIVSWQTVPGAERSTAVIVGLLSGLAVLWFWLTTRYRISDTSMHLHSGPFHKELPLGRIQRVSRSRRLWGINFALSRDVLLIEMSGSAWAYHVSPQDRRGFVETLADRCHHVELDGDGLRPRGTG